jgi:hypothetical protein
MGRNRGNPNWGKVCADIPKQPTSFEEIVQRLKLSEKDYQSSAQLKDWVEANKDVKYVPQDLLKAWGIEVKF